MALKAKVRDYAVKEFAALWFAKHFGHRSKTIHRIVILKLEIEEFVRRAAQYTYAWRW